MDHSTGPIPKVDGRQSRAPTPREGEAKPPSTRTLRGLDWLNFFLADVQSGVGPFLAIYLAGYKWNEQRVGLALTIGGIAGIGVLPVRAILYTLTHNMAELVAIQILDGIASAIFGVVSVSSLPQSQRPHSASSTSSCRRRAISDF
jgi:hypothetical protein